MDIWTSIISGITLLAAIFSPVITTIVNNRFAAKRYKAEYYERHRAEVIEKYIQSAGKAIKHSNSDAFQQFGESAMEIYFYINPDQWFRLDKIDELISEFDYAGARRELREFCKEISYSNPPRLKKKSAKNEERKHVDDIKYIGFPRP